MNPPKLSIITPVYNNARYIDYCIQNVIDQKCPAVEHIIIDGESTDGTVQKIKHYAAQYSHIRWISEKDEGQSDALNKGIAMAGGRILGSLNSDDFYEPDVLNRILEMFDLLPEPGFLFADCYVRNERDEITGLWIPSKINFLDLLKGVHVCRHPFNPAAYFYHASLHDKAGLYDSNIKISMDLDFIIRAVQVANLRYVNETWGNFRIIEGTKTFHIKKQGKVYEVDKNILKKYWKQLPPMSQVIVRVIFEVFHRPSLENLRRFGAYIRRIPFYLRNPIQTVRLIKRRFWKIAKYFHS